MSALEAIFLGLVQGLTEFFPVSSSGHLAMFQSLFGGRTGGSLIFEIGLHVATLVAIVLFYRTRILELIVGAFRLDRPALDYAGKLALGTLPAVIVGLLAKDEIESVFSSDVLVAFALLTTGVILWTTRSTLPRAHGGAPTWAAALLIGCAQAFAILPGISRSGSTVAMALALGIAPAVAAEFSFLLGIIAIAGAGVLMIPELGSASSELLTSVALGGVAALLSGIAAIWLFVRMLEKRTFYHFAWYAWAVGGAFLVWTLLGGGA